MPPWGSDGVLPTDRFTLLGALAGSTDPLLYWHIAHRTVLCRLVMALVIEPQPTELIDHDRLASPSWRAVGGSATPSSPENSASKTSILSVHA